MISEELINKLQVLDDHRIQIAAKTADGLALLRQTYFDVFGNHYQENCAPCHEKAFYKLIKVLHNPQTFTLMSDRKYLLKAGYQISEFGSPDVFTNDNLTDESAAKLLKKRPALAASFQIINGKAASEFTADDSKAAAGKTAEEVIALIAKAETLDELKALAEGDKRKTVLAAAQAKLEELEAAGKTAEEGDDSE